MRKDWFVRGRTVFTSASPAHRSRATPRKARRRPGGAPSTRAPRRASCGTWARASRAASPRRRLPPRPRSRPGLDRVTRVGVADALRRSHQVPPTPPSRLRTGLPPGTDELVPSALALVSIPTLLSCPRFELDLSLTHQDELRVHRRGQAYRRHGCVVAAAG